MAAQSPPRTVLVVDDDPDIRDYAALVLQGCGYSVLTAVDGADALSVLGSNSGIDLLFTDIVMPGIDGFEVARRATQQSPGLKVLFTSGYATEVSDAGRLLRKPYRPQQLEGEVKAALGCG